MSITSANAYARNREFYQHTPIGRVVINPPQPALFRIYVIANPDSSKVLVERAPCRTEAQFERNFALLQSEPEKNKFFLVLQRRRRTQVCKAGNG